MPTARMRKAFFEDIMSSIIPYLLQIPGVETLPDSASCWCRTPKAVVEVCKMSGTFLWADPNQKLKIEGTESIGNDRTLIILSKAEPIRENIALHGSTNEGIAPRQSVIRVDDGVKKNLDELVIIDTDPVRRVTMWPIDRTFVYIDVSDFSKQKPGKQAMIINSIVHAVDHEGFWVGSRAEYAKSEYEAQICIGDGYIFVYKKPENAVMFAAYFSDLVEHLHANKQLPVDFHFRIGVHVGEVLCFWDPGRDDWNYIGDGINGGQRVLAAIGKETDDVVFISGQVRRRLQEASSGDPGIADLLRTLHNRGRRADKHGRAWTVYEMNHTDLMGGYFTSQYKIL